MFLSNILKKKFDLYAKFRFFFTLSTSLGGLFFIFYLFLKKSAYAPTTLVVAISPDSPPFEQYQKGTLAGFDVDLATELGKIMNRKVIFQPMDFSMIFLALNNQGADMAISSIQPTEKRSENFHFSSPYHFIKSFFIYKKDKKFVKKGDFFYGHHIGCPMGTTMEEWAKKQGSPQKKTRLTAFDQPIHIVQGVLSGRLDMGLVESGQAQAFCRKFPDLRAEFATSSPRGFSVTLPKNSLLKKEIEHALKILKERKILKNLEKKWLSLLKTSVFNKGVWT